MTSTLTAYTYTMNFCNKGLNVAFSNNIPGWKSFTVNTRRFHHPNTSSTEMTLNTGKLNHAGKDSYRVLCFS